MVSQLIQTEPLLVSDQTESSRINCPACGTECSRIPLYRYTVSEAAGHFCPITRNADRNRRLAECIKRLWQADNCIVLRCGDCGFGFGFPFVGGDEDFYSILHEQKHYPTWRWDYDVALKEAVGKFAGGRILDIGAGAGMFLRRLNFSWTRYALEASESTRRELEALGVRVFRQLSQLVEAEAGTFQIVTLFQVLEHIADFDSLLMACRRLLGNGGLLVVTVPDAEAMIRQEKLTGCHDMPPNHINKWTPASLTKVLVRAGFQVGQPISEPASWRNLKSSVHMRVMADAASQSVAAQIYGIQNRTLRVIALSCLGVPALFRMLPNCLQLCRGGAFALIGVSR